MATDSDRRSYEANSPFYRELVDRFGDRLTTAQAAMQCRRHGLTLADLREDEPQLPLDRIPTLDFVMALGY